MDEGRPDKRTKIIQLSDPLILFISIASHNHHHRRPRRTHHHISIWRKPSPETRPRSLSCLHLHTNLSKFPSSSWWITQFRTDRDDDDYVQPTLEHTRSINAKATNPPSHASLLEIYTLSLRTLLQPHSHVQ